MVSVGVVLEQFPDEVISYVTNPATGIQRRLKWPPTINEIVEACEEQLTYFERLRRPKRLPEERIPPPRLKEMPKGYLAQVFIPENHPRYHCMVDLTKIVEPVWWKFEPSSDGRKGLWVSHSMWQGRM